MSFIGREKPLADLLLLKQKNSASLVVIKGRRRIGKSRLAEEFSHSFPRAYTFTGVPPDSKITSDMQREEFIRQLHRQKIPSASSNDWGDLLFDLAKFCSEGETLVILDEVTWMGSKDPSFLGKLKIAWDETFKKNPKLILIISGSNSAWIEDNILSKTGFFGRVSYRLTLEELSLKSCVEFWGEQRRLIAPYEMLKILAVTGGVPRYLEEIQPTLTAEHNLLRLCYQPEGILFNEFDDIFSDLFRKHDKQYREVIIAIANGSKTIDSIAKSLGRSKGGDLSQLLQELTKDGFLSRDYSWQLNTGKHSKFSHYRIRDNYLRFYLRYILPHRHQIEINAMDSLPQGWESIIGLQFENLVLNNRKKLIEILGIPSHEIIMSNPYLQTQTKTTQKCQIDFMIQTQFNTLYACEIKFTKAVLGLSVVQEMKNRLETLNIPKGFSIRPVLIHVNGVNDNVLAARFFSNIVNFSDFLK